MDYVAKHASALEKLRQDGVAVAFASESNSPTDYNPLTDASVAPSNAVVTGLAVEIPGDPEEYTTLELVPSQTTTLFFVPDVMGATPALGNTIVWAGVLRTVKFIFPIRPIGVLIAARVLVV